MLNKKLKRIISIGTTCILTSILGSGTLLANTNKNILDSGTDNHIVQTVEHFKDIQTSYGKQPNIIYILADDLGWGDLGSNGQKEIKTPRLDQLRDEGMYLLDHYSGSTVCAPSRASLMTGMHIGNSPIRGNDATTLSPSDTTVAELLQSNGYKTGMIGKWGIGEYGTTGAPNLKGFDHFFGYTDQTHAHRYYPEFLWRNGEKEHLGGKKYSHDLLTEDALKFIDDNKEEPFFLYLPYTLPHFDIAIPDKHMGDYGSKPWPREEQIFAAMVSLLDRDVGMIDDKLKELGISENTLLIFTSDNGAHNEGHNVNYFNSNGGFRGWKRDLYEGGIRTPMLAKWPGTIEAGSESEHISAFWDILPTLCDLTGIESPQGIDGISFAPTLLGKEADQEKHDYLYWWFQEGARKDAIRMEDWKGVRVGNNATELYNLKNDWQEKSNIASSHPDIVKQIESYMLEANSPLITIKLNKTTLPLIKGKSETLVTTVQNTDNKSVTWSSNNNKVAKVDASGKVTAVGQGEAIIMATTVDGKRAAICNVSVNDYITIDDNQIGSGFNQFNYNPSGQGGWQANNKPGAYNNTTTFNASGNSAHYAELKFTGQQVKLYGNPAPNGGIAAISIDGGPEMDVDYYASEVKLGELVYTSPILPQGDHILKIKVTGRVNSANTSGTKVINIDKADIFDAVQETEIDAPETVEASEEFNVKVMLQGLQDIVAHDITITYDEDALEYIDGYASTVNGLEIIEKKDELGQVRFIIASLGKDNVVNGAVELLNLKFRAKEYAPTGDIGIKNVMIANSQGEMLTMGDAQKTITITNTEEPTTVDKTSLKNEIDKANNLIKDAAPGTYPTSAIDQLTAAIRVAQRIYDDIEATKEDVADGLQVIKQAISDFKASIIQTPTADVNMDGEVNIADLALVAYYYQSKAGDDNWTKAQKVDVNKDNRIGTEDLAIVAKEILGKTI